jgi:hypothetical protein
MLASSLPPQPLAAVAVTMQADRLAVMRRGFRFDESMHVNVNRGSRRLTIREHDSASSMLLTVTTDGKLR